MSRDLELFVPGFPGFATPEWASLLSEPRRSAARQYAEFGGGKSSRLDENDYMRLFEEVGDQEAQRTAIASNYVQMFGIKLALNLGIPHGLRFLRYDVETDRILASLPLGALRWILENRATDERGSCGVSPEDREAIIEYGYDPSEVPSIAAARALRRLDRVKLGELLGGFTSPRIGAAAAKVIARRDADLAFAESMDWQKLRAEAWALRSEKRRRLLEDTFGIALSPPVSRR
ncbi:MAG: hypothetical protein QHD01_02905 [Bradyrhizobium sp.]|uniref:hypothetical protein n=1 Tax=Bradyrhizobium sp. TaxID=376 RepID=UPI0029B22C80|nr:hypothetical protein [Bradyrhizobium sp.]MDX3965534.1 hypothetical protein [Bradyrhizobium sp.]